MELPAGANHLHQPVRLRLMALLLQRGDVGFAAACRAIGATPGNLDGHARRLEQQGFLVSRRELLRTGFETRYRITPAGQAAFNAYLAWLESMLTTARTPESADPAPK